MSIKLMLLALGLGILLGEIVIWVAGHFDFVLTIAVFSLILYVAAVTLGCLPPL